MKILVLGGLDMDFIKWKLASPLEIANMALLMNEYSAAQSPVEARERARVALREAESKTTISGKTDVHKKRPYGTLVSDRKPDCKVRIVFSRSSSEKNKEFPQGLREWHSDHSCLIDEDARIQLDEHNNRAFAMPVAEFEAIGQFDVWPRPSCSKGSAKEVETISSALKSRFTGRHLCAEREQISAK